jgi:hypothetical protein
LKHQQVILRHSFSLEGRITEIYPCGGICKKPHPEPFCLEIDTRQEPWTLIDCTEHIATAGERAAEEHTRAERQKLDQAAQVLVQALQQRVGTSPLQKQEAETLLMAQGLSKRVARTLLEQGGNHDVYPDGWWVLRPIPGERGHPVGVYLAGEEDGGRNNHDRKSPCEQATSAEPISATRSTPSGRNSHTLKSTETLEKKDGVFRPPHECEVAEMGSEEV